MDELEHVAQFLFEGKRVVGPAAFAATYEQGARLPFDGIASMFIIVHELGHYLNVVVTPFSNQARVLDPLNRGDDVRVRTMLLHLRAAYKRTFDRELVSVVFDQCEAQPDSVQCSLFCLRSAHLWLTNQPQLCAPGGEVERDAQLARLADIAAMVRAGKCSCKECRQRRMVRGFARLIEASAKRGSQRPEDKPRVNLVPKSFVVDGCVVPVPCAGPAVRPRLAELFERVLDLRDLLIKSEVYCPVRGWLPPPSPAAPPPGALAPPAAAAASAAPVKRARPPSPDVIVLDGPPVGLHGRARRRRRGFQLLEAPLDWPPGQRDSVLLSNADLVRYVGTLLGFSLPALTACFAWLQPQARCVPERPAH